MIRTYQDVLYIHPSKTNLAQTTAHLDEGVLKVRVPKKVGPTSRDVVITSSYAPAAATDAEYRVEVDVPGVKIDQLCLSIHEGTLYMKAHSTFGGQQHAMVF